MESDKKPRLVLLVGAPCSLARRRLAYSLPHHRNHEHASFFITSAARIEDLESLKAEWEDACTIEKTQPFVCSPKITVEELKSLGLSSEQIRIVFFWSEEDTCHKASLLDKTAPEVYSEAWRTYIEWAQEFLAHLKADAQLFSRIWFVDSSDDDFSTQTELISYIMDDIESNKRPNPTTAMTRVNQTLKPERKRNKGEAISILQQSKRLLDKRAEALLKQTINVLTNGSAEDQEQMLHLFYGVIAGTASWREEKNAMQRVILIRKTYWQGHSLKYCQILCLIAIKWTEEYRANPTATPGDLAVMTDRFSNMLNMTATDQKDIKEYLLCGLCRVIKHAAHHLYFAPEMFETDEFWRLSQTLLSTSSLMLRTYGCSLASGALRDDHLRYSYRVIEFEKKLGQDNAFSFVHAIRDTIFSTMELIETFTPQSEEDNAIAKRYLALFANRDVALVLQLLIDGVHDLCNDLSSDDVNKLIRYAALANKYYPSFAGNIYGSIDAILKWGTRAIVAEIDLQTLLENVSSCISQLIKEANHRVLRIVVALFNQVLKLTQRSQIFSVRGDSYEEDEESEPEENKDKVDMKEDTSKVKNTMQIDTKSKLIDLLQSWRDLEERWKKPSSARDFMSTKSLQDAFKTELDRLSREEVTLQLAEQKQQNVELAEQLEKMTKLKEAADAEKSQLQAELARLRAELIKPQLHSSSEVVKVSTSTAIESSTQVEDQSPERDPLLDITDPTEVSPEAALRFIDNLKQKRDSLKTLRKTICGSLRQLGPDLYSLSSHFINELIQNADDNQYSTGTTPSVLITLNEDSILFACNECGFLARDVESLCNLSVSTKTGGAHIGQKGLGFKSVFSVTNAPIIVSGPWQFCFNKTPEKDEMAYITPLWLASEQFPPELSQAVLKHQEYRTFIYLPLMKRVQSNIREFYDDVYRSLDKHVLLTLKQLKKITIIDRLNAQHTVVSCTVPSNIVSLPAGALTVQNYQQDLRVTTTTNEGEKSQTNSQQFHVLKADVHVPADIVAEDKQRASETNIMLAFPLVKDLRQDETFPIFAYLPVSDIGFKFLLQCDWILVTNRESIQDKAWNRYLRDTAAEMLKWALLNHPSIYAHAWEFIPEHNPAMSRWWSLFVDNVHAVLKDERLKKLLSSDASGHNKKELVMPDNKVLDVVPAGLIEQYSNVQLLDSAQLNSEKIKLISSYVRRLSAIDVLDCFDHSGFKDYANNQTEVWWENLFKLFNGLPLTTIDKYATKIKQAPIFLFGKTRGPMNDQYCFVSPAGNIIKPWRHDFNVVCYMSSSEKHFLEGQLHLTPLVPQRVVELLGNIHLQAAINKTTQETSLLWQDLTYIRDHLLELTEDLIEKLKLVLLVPSSTQVPMLLSALTVPTLLTTDVSKHVMPSVAYPYGGKFESLEEDMHWEWFFLEMNAVPPVNLLSIKPAPSLELNPLANWSEQAAAFGQQILTYYSNDSPMTPLIRNMIVKLSDGSQLPISKVANASVFRDALPSIEVPPHASKVADMLGVCSTTTATNSLEILTAFARTNNTNIEKYTEWLWRLKNTLGNDKVDAVYASQPLLYLDDDKRFAAPQDIYLCNIDNHNRAVTLVCKTLNKSLINLNANNNYLPFVSLLRTLGSHTFPTVADICAALNEMAKNQKYFLPVGSEMSLLSNDGLEDFIATYQLLEMALKRDEQLSTKGTVDTVEPDNPLYLHNWTWRNLHRSPGTLSGNLPIPLHSKRLVFLKDTKNIRACLQDPIIKSVSNVDPVPFVHPTIAINCPRAMTALQVQYIEQISVVTLGHTGANIEYKLQQVSEAFQHALGKQDITVLSVKYIPCSIVYSHLRSLSTTGVIDGNDVMSVMIKSDIPYLICDDTLVYCAVKTLPHSARMSIISSALTNMLLRKNVTWSEEEAQKHAFKALKECTADSNIAWSKSLSSEPEEFDTELVVFPTPAEGSLSQNFHYFADNQRVEQDASGSNQIVSFDDVLSPLAVSDPAMIERIKSLDARSDLFSCPHLTTDERPYMFTPQDAKRIGDDAEQFFCAYLANKYGQAFNPYVSWVSGSRTAVYPNSTSNINEKAGYDFVLIDTLQLFTQDRSQNKKAKKCYFEVKGFAKDWNGQIEISDNQLKVRKHIAEVERDTSVYFVAIVYHVDSPELTNVFLVDWSNEDVFEPSPVKYLATYKPPSNTTRHERREQQDRSVRTDYSNNNRYERRDQQDRGGRSDYYNNRRQQYNSNYDNNQRKNSQRYGQTSNAGEQAQHEQPPQQQIQSQNYSLPPPVLNPQYGAQNTYFNPNFPPQFNAQPMFYGQNYGYANYSQQPQPVQYTVQTPPPRGQQRNNGQNNNRGNYQRGNEGQRNNEQQPNYKRQKTTHPDNNNNPKKDGDTQYRRK